MVPMPQPIKVWMVHLERGLSESDVKGRLELLDDVLAFTAEGSGQVTEFALGQAVSVKRLLGSPVLVLGWMREGRRTRTAFYLTKPPPLRPPDPLQVPGGVMGMRKASARRQKRDNAGYLTAKAGDFRPVLKAWVKECSEKMRQAKAN